MLVNTQFNISIVFGNAAWRMFGVKLEVTGR